MARIGKEMARLFSSLPTDEKTLIARRAAEVRTMWKDAIEYVYKENAPYVLDHVNAVYIKEEEGIRSLYVYMDDGNFRSDVHCRQHLIMLRLHERFGEMSSKPTLPDSTCASAILIEMCAKRSLKVPARFHFPPRKKSKLSRWCHLLRTLRSGARWKRRW